MLSGERKAPAEEKTYGLNWLPQLGADDTIASSAWTIDDDLTQEDVGFTDTTTTIKVSGGVGGRDYVLTNLIETEGGSRLEESIFIPCYESSI